MVRQATSSESRAFVSKFGGKVSPATQRGRAFVETFGSGGSGSATSYQENLAREQARQEEIVRVAAEQEASRKAESQRQVRLEAQRQEQQKQQALVEQQRQAQIEQVAIQEQQERAERIRTQEREGAPLLRRGEGESRKEFQERLRERNIKEVEGRIRKLDLDVAAEEDIKRKLANKIKRLEEGKITSFNSPFIIDESGEEIKFTKSNVTALKTTLGISTVTEKTKDFIDKGLELGIQEINGRPITTLELSKEKAKQLFEGAVKNVIKANQIVSSRIPTIEDIQNRLTSRLTSEQKEIIKKQIEQIKKEEPTKTKVIRGAGEAIFEDIRTQPIKQVALFGAGVGIGAGLKLFGAGALAIGGTKGLSIAEKVATVGGVGLFGKFAFDVSKDISLAASPEEKGGIIGVTFKDVTLIGLGAKPGIRISERIVDFVRVRGLTEITGESIIAPEFFRGQRFPSVKRGQTARELRAEFFEVSLPTEVSKFPRGFTASPADFAKVTTIEAGTSEVAGLFSAPKISPHFLRAGGETRFKFGFKNLLTFSRPTALRLEFKTLEFPPGVTGKTKVGGKPLSIFKGFFEEVRGTGRTFIPAAKTEKEAITAADTLIRQTAKEFFFKFEGRKVPVKEFEIVGGDLPIQPRVTTLGKVVLEEGSVSSSAALNPLNIQLTSISKRRKDTTSRISKVTSSSSIPSSVSSFRFIPSVSRGGAPSRKRPVGEVSRPTPSEPRRPPLTIPRESSIPRGISRPRPILTTRKTPSVSYRRPPIRFLKPRGERKIVPFGLDLRGKTKKREVPSFNVLVRRFGKFRPIGTGLTLGEAVTRGKRRVRTTLAATFKVQPTGKLIKDKETSFSINQKEFRRPKRKRPEEVGLVFVQRAPFRLGTRGEVIEIKGARRKSGTQKKKK